MLNDLKYMPVDLTARSSFHRDLVAVGRWPIVKLDHNGT
jgi:hypothetical protein